MRHGTEAISSSSSNEDRFRYILESEIRLVQLYTNKSISYNNEYTTENTIQEIVKFTKIGPRGEIFFEKMTVKRRMGSRI